MVKFQRNYLPVDEDFRRQPRIEFQLPVSIIGFEVQAYILDFSLEGFYIQVDRAADFNEGQSLRLALRFPAERNLSMIKVRVARIDTHGIGCEFIDLEPTMKELIDRNFEIFSSTLPIQ
ncbi:MAG: PilZ domain-containing protein [Desulfobacterales bacterium]|nr:PilZ domain-containing protein [Desulfobacterales bacterium]